MPTNFSVIHASMKWDRVKRPQFGKDLAALQKTCLVIVLTEIGGLTDGELRKAAGEWVVFRGPNVPGQDECAILWHPSLTPVAAGSVQKLSDLQYQQADGDWMPKFYAAVQPLRFPDGQVVTVVGIHMPLRNTARRVKVSDDCLRFLAQWLPTIEGHVVVSADWNIAWRKAEGRALLEPLAAATGLTWAWQDNVEGFDTKRSLIDGVLTDLPVRESTLLPAIASSDHWPVRVDLTLPDPAPLPTPPQEAPVATSQNGYTANDRSRVVSMTIPGTTRKVSLRSGAPGELLCEFAGWFDKNIESVDGGILDDWGYAERPIRGSSTTLSNHASGTAIDLNAPRHPLGKRNTFTAEQERKIRAELKRYEGAIRWGGDYKNRADEMHFEIMASPERCAEVLARVRAGVPVKEAPVGNNVQQGRALVVQALAKFDAARLNGKTRLGVQLMARAIRVALASGPKS